MRCQIAKRLSLGLEEAPFFCRDTGALAAAQATSWTRHLEIPTTKKEWRMGASGPRSREQEKIGMDLSMTRLENVGVITTYTICLSGLSA